MFSPNVRLIWFREVRDQLRDRRTVFMIAVLPLLLYPLLGMLFLKMTQFMQQQPTRIWVVGAAELSSEPALFARRRFATELCPEDEARLLQLTFRDSVPEPPHDEAFREIARGEIRRDGYDAVVLFPADFSARLAELPSVAVAPAKTGVRGRSVDLPPVPQPEILFDQASDASRIAADRVERVLSRWREAVVRRLLESRGVSPAVVKPFETVRTDVSEEIGRRAAVWSRILPFVLVVWALTGAFYPAIDLCAGEKERGTLETLLCSPATRGEIVGGKLLTVMTFSVATAYLNLFSLGATGVFILRQIGAVAETGLRLDLGAPPAVGCRLAVAGCVARVRAVQRLGVGHRSFCSQRQGRSVLPDATAPDFVSADDAAAAAVGAAGLGHQPDSRERPGALAAATDRSPVPRRIAVRRSGGGGHGRLLLARHALGGPAV